MHEKDPVARNLAISLDEARAGYARITMRVGDHMVNAYGTTHGGYSFILADTAFGLASNNRGRKSFAQAAHITFMTFGKPGELLTAVAEERSVSGRTGIFDATVYGEDGRVVAEFNGLSRAVKGPSGV
ncbi:MAG: hotdog fold thioesterase [Rhodospirillaceae bacterium]|nr:hotdog fold thioesterase [Rhodospirillaceae bacterium]MBT5191482.1 hotdog fold thioesterase [Rhodospirillaceae bacterium]MBT5899187.1 hotdog fold thioesterase [Rhodospirillaceae bacterium]